MKLLIQGLKFFIFGFLFGLGIYTFDLVAISVSGTFNSFFAGQTLKASEINTNFSTLKTAIESIPDWTKNGVNAVFLNGGVAVATSSLANSSNLTVNGRISSSSIGVYCGVTASTYNGSTVGGYTGAKSKCETACGNTNAHMCTAHELSISRQLNITITQPSWYSAYGYWIGDITPRNITECSGWTSNSATEGGSNNNAGGPTWNLCNSLFQIACCL